MLTKLGEEFSILMNAPTKKDGDALEEKTIVHVTVEAMTEGEAQMINRILALCDVDRTSSPRQGRI